MPGEGIVGIMRRRPNGAARPLWMWGTNWRGDIGDSTGYYSRSSPVQTIAYGNNWAKVSLGRCVAATKTDGSLWLWGNNEYGQLGNNTAGFYTAVSSPVQTVAGGTNWSDVAVGVFHTIAVKTNGTLWGWGYGLFGSLAENMNQFSSPVQIGTSTTWSKVAAGLHSMGLKTDGTLWAWGWNSGGQQGINTYLPNSSPVQVGAENTWASVSAFGTNSTAAIKKDGTLWTWGLNAGFDYPVGNLGDNTIIHRSSPVQTVAGGTNWTQVSVGLEHVGAVKSDGTLWMWGRNIFGELGDNTRVNKSSPIQTITFANNWKMVACGHYITAGIKNDTTLWSWGCNYDGILGINGGPNRSSPVQVAGYPSGWTLVYAGESVFAGIQGTDLPPAAPAAPPPSTPQPFPTNNGYMWNWGNNTNGSLGDNSTTHRSSPIQCVASAQSWKQASGGENHAVAIKVDGTLWTFGLNDNGQLGDNTVVKKSSPIQTIALGTTWSQVSAGYRHSIGVKSDGTIWTWGLNTNGQLGDNSITHRSSPVQVVGFATTWVSSSSGKNHAGAIKTDGTLWTFGLNDNGQLGDNTVVKKSSPIQTIALGTNWKYVSCGQNHSAGVKFDGTLWTWGINTYGQLGENSTTHRSSPIQTTSFGTSWAMVSCGSNSTYAIKTDGTLWSWGRNSYGELGNNTLTHRSSPVQVTYTSQQWSTVSGGYNHAIGITSFSAWTWGRNNYGQGDNDDIINYSQPRAINLANFDWIDLFSGSSSNSTYSLAFTTLTPPPSSPPTPTPTAPTPTAPSPAPLTPASAFAFASADEHLYKFYIVPLKNLKTAIVCLEEHPDIKSIAGPFGTFEEAKEAQKTLKNQNNPI